MMRVIIPNDSEFKFDECKALYEKNKKILKEDSSFEEVLNNTLFYSFYDEDLLTLCIYFYETDGKLWLNGYGIRKKHLFNKQCLIKALSWFNCDIWAKSTEKAAIYGLLVCGFTKFKDNIYVYRQK